ncbi:uncharacterized protein LOC132065323 isoform X2 [Lycium ferocissimum]|uniref:uncharacterized protein LOC132065323 isoform X1 n=1 Tax=Lycium ferocissimum TaxID=112874 RepID=UPI00281598EC|nr:uncharacterized protein LOC132065323 isoform X1 [Lycium ferocissimum]XP_059314636.1 uncharacterized protein LOC132065323 isoform X2 [Lycium ferocissimum]
MISILTQERLLGAALGSVLTGVVVLEQRKSIYKSISENQSRFSSHSQTTVLMPKKESGIEFAHLWNKAVDQALGPVIKSLGTRGW